jgi:hypothetical protein
MIMGTSGEFATGPSGTAPRLERRYLQDGFVLILGCLLVLFVLDRRAAVLVAVWWGLTVIIVRSDLDHLLIPDWASGGIALLAPSRPPWNELC